MKKYVIAILVIFIAAFLLWKWSENRSNSQLENELNNVISTTTGLATNSSISTQNISASITSTDKAEKNKAWAVLESYLNYAKNKDLKGLASLSYQVSDSCKSALVGPSSPTYSPDNSDCLTKVSNVYALGKDFQEKDFTTMWSDSKQIILSSDWKHWDGNGITGLIHSVIYFVKTSDGTKLLSFNPSKGSFINITASSTQSQNDATLAKKVQDSDQDGISDNDEMCVDDTSVSCIKTDPHKRDSNGNGYWDGIEALFYKK